MSFWVILQIHREPLLDTVSLPLCTCPVTLTLVFSVFQPIVQFIFLSLLNHAKAIRFSDKLGTRKRTFSPSTTWGGTHSTMTWAVVGRSQQVKRGAKGEEKVTTNIEQVRSALSLRMWEGVFPPSLKVSCITSIPSQTLTVSSTLYQVLCSVVCLAHPSVFIYLV